MPLDLYLYLYWSPLKSAFKHIPERWSTSPAFDFLRFMHGGVAIRNPWRRLLGGLPPCLSLPAYHCECREVKRRRICDLEHYRMDVTERVETYCGGNLVWRAWYDVLNANNVAYTWDPCTFPQEQCIELCTGKAYALMLQQIQAGTNLWNSYRTASARHCWRNELEQFKRFQTTEI